MFFPERTFSASLTFGNLSLSLSHSFPEYAFLVNVDKRQSGRHRGSGIFKRGVPHGKVMLKGREPERGRIGTLTENWLEGRSRVRKEGGEKNSLFKMKGNFIKKVCAVGDQIGGVWSFC